MKRNVLTYFIIAFSLVGCGGKTVQEIPLTILLDQKINLELVGEDSLHELLKPFESGENKDTLSAITPVFFKVDALPIIRDSIQSNASLLRRAGDWLGGGKKNSVRFDKNRTRDLNNKTFNTSLGQNGPEAYVDSFFLKGITYVVYSNDEAIISHYDSVGVKTFKRLDDLKFFISRLNIKTKDDIFLYYKPRSKLLRLPHRWTLFNPPTDSTSIVRVPLPQPPPPPKDTDGDGIADIIDKCKTEFGFPRYDGCPMPKNNPDQITDKECDSRIEHCLRMPNDMAKVNYFFNDIFRFSRITKCNEANYRNLISSIYMYMISNPPTYNGGFSENGASQYYSLSCSNVTDFKEELIAKNISFSISAYDNNIKNKCP